MSYGGVLSQLGIRRFPARICSVTAITAVLVWIFVIAFISSDVQDKEERSPADHVFGGNHRSGQSAKVLLLAYFRSGSSFASQTLAKLNGSFYVFEPLHVMEYILLQTNKNLVFLNGSSRAALTAGYEIPFVVELLQSLLNCQFDKVDTATLELGYLPKYTWQIRSYLDCVGNSSSEISNENTADCLGQLKRSCLEASVRVIKTIRLSMRTVEDILKGVPDLKVLHLIRDPRGQFVSGLEHSLQDHGNFQEKVCNLVTSDVQTRQRLEPKYPDTFMEVIYEDLVQKPRHTLSAIYRFIGVPLPNYMIQWIRDVTSSSNEKLEYLFTPKKNATKTAYAWVAKCPWVNVLFFQRRCQWLLKHGRFPMIGSPTEQDEFVIPRRDPL